MGNSNLMNDTMRVQLHKRHTRIITQRDYLWAMDLIERLHQLLELDELKNDTATTKAIQEVIRKFLSLDGSKKVELQQLVEK